MLKGIKLFVIFIALSLTLYLAYSQLHEDFKVVKQKIKAEELLYFPNGQALQLVSFGFDNTLADLLWFQTVNYFGKHYRSDKNYTWLNHMCEVVTDLDPMHMDIYEFCALLLAWEHNQPEQAILLLKKAINVKPDYWRNYYLRAMTLIIFKLGADKARDDFITASHIPDCPVFIKELASRKIGELQSPQDTISFLKDMAARATDDSQHQSLNERYSLAQHEKNIIDLQGFADSYKQQKGQFPISLSELGEIGIVLGSLKDPFGGTYYISPEGKVISTSNKKLLYLFSERPKNEKGNKHK